jgi:hypothetical protein
MREIIEIKTNYIIRNHIRFNRFNLFVKNWPLVLVSIIFFTFSGLVAIIRGHSIGFAIIIVGILLPFFFLLILNMTTKRYLRSFNVFEGERNIYYRFDNEKILNEIKTKDFKTTFEPEWGSVYCIYEVEDFFYIYIRNMQAYIIPKKDIVLGSEEDLKKLFSAKSKEQNFKIRFRNCA